MHYPRILFAVVAFATRYGFPPGSGFDTGVSAVRARYQSQVTDEQSATGYDP